MVCVLYSAIRRATFDKFGEEGLKAGVVTSEGGTCIHMYMYIKLYGYMQDHAYI